MKIIRKLENSDDGELEEIISEHQEKTEKLTEFQDRILVTLKKQVSRVNSTEEKMSLVADALQEIDDQIETLEHEIKDLNKLINELKSQDQFTYFQNFDYNKLADECFDDPYNELIKNHGRILAQLKDVTEVVKSLNDVINLIYVAKDQELFFAFLAFSIDLVLKSAKDRNSKLSVRKLMKVLFLFAADLSLKLSDEIRKQAYHQLAHLSGVGFDSYHYINHAENLLNLANEKDISIHICNLTHKIRVLPMLINSDENDDLISQSELIKEFKQITQEDPFPIELIKSRSKSATIKAYHGMRIYHLINEDEFDKAKEFLEILIADPEYEEDLYVAILRILLKHRTSRSAIKYVKTKLMGDLGDYIGWDGKDLVNFIWSLSDYYIKYDVQEFLVIENLIPIILDKVEGRFTRKNLNRRLWRILHILDCAYKNSNHKPSKGPANYLFRMNVRKKLVPIIHDYTVKLGLDIDIEFVKLLVLLKINIGKSELRLIRTTLEKKVTDTRHLDIFIHSLFRKEILFGSIEIRNACLDMALDLLEYDPECAFHEQFPKIKEDENELHIIPGNKRMRLVQTAKRQNRT